LADSFSSADVLPDQVLASANEIKKAAITNSLLTKPQSSL
jgi:hypothetical protein